MSIVNSDKCCGCAACFSICPQRCISMQPNQEGFLEPDVDMNQCVHCELCKQACPMLNTLEDRAAGHYPNVYIGYNLDEDIRMLSSSGGVFSLLAERIIQAGGIVFGAAMTGDCRQVKHISVDSMIGLRQLRGSKYVQSDIGDAFIKVEIQLKSKRQVLFSGTPCQVEGLKRFLGIVYPNLFCVDFICHGVPSNKAWVKYVELHEKRRNSTAISFRFRDKATGWEDYSVAMEFANGREYRQHFEDDHWGQAFVRNTMLRESCYHCAFRRINRPSDITVADAWGLGKTYTELFDNKGTSLVYIHSRAGQKLFDGIRDQMNYGQCAKDEQINLCQRLLYSTPKHPQCDLFFQNLDAYEFDELVKKFAKPSIKNRIRYFLRKLGLLDAVKALMHK